MNEKLRFVYEYERHERTMTELYWKHGISRETGSGGAPPKRSLCGEPALVVRGGLDEMG
jgi:hypothetical protein